MANVVNFETKEKGTTATAMVSIPVSLRDAVKKAYPNINLSATVRASLQEILDAAPKSSTKGK